MARCIHSHGLEVHHKRRMGGNSLSNAEVLCEACRKAADSREPAGVAPSPFSEETKARALAHAHNRCECVKIGCH